MRSLVQVNARQSVQNFAAVVRKFQQIRAILFLLTIGITVGLTASVLAEEEEETSTPSKPEIINFHVSFDGIDQYYVSGQVVGVDDPDGLTVEFGDYISGESTETAWGGYFGYMVILAYGEEETFSATVVSHEGVQSDRVRGWPG